MLAMLKNSGVSTESLPTEFTENDFRKALHDLLTAVIADFAPPSFAKFSVSPDVLDKISRFRNLHHALTFPKILSDKTILGLPITADKTLAPLTVRVAWDDPHKRTQIEVDRLGCGLHVSAVVLALFVVVVVCVSSTAGFHEQVGDALR